MRRLIKLVLLVIIAGTLSSCVRELKIQEIDVSIEYVLENTSTGQSIIQDSFYTSEPYPELRASIGDILNLKLNILVDGQISSSDIKCAFLESEETVVLSNEWKKEFVISSVDKGKYPLTVSGLFEVSDPQWSLNGYTNQVQPCGLVVTSFIIID